MLQKTPFLLLEVLVNPQTWHTVLTDVSKRHSWWIPQLSLADVTSFSWRRCFVNRMHDAFELCNTVSFMHRNFIFLFPSTARWSSFLHNSTKQLEFLWIEIGKLAQGVFVFIVFSPLLPSSKEKVKATVSLAKCTEGSFLSSNTMQHEREDFLNSNKERAS